MALDRMQLVTLVAEMRSAQIQYFRTRSTGDLERSKILERRVDAAIAEALDGQGTLFDPEEASARR
jgi:hypothetical protein